MAEARLQQQIAALRDVDLVRMLSVDAADHAPEALALARAEADRRGLAVDGELIAASADVEVAEGGLLPYEAGGVAVRCPHCGNDAFESRQVLLNTRGLTFVRLDWLNRSATALVCGTCGLIQLFAEPPVALPYD